MNYIMKSKEASIKMLLNQTSATCPLACVISHLFDPLVLIAAA